MSGEGTEAPWSACDLDDAATVFLVAGGVLAVLAVDAALSYAGMAIACGAVVTLSSSTFRRSARRRKGFRGCDGRACQFAFPTYGMVALEWEKLRDVAAKAPGSGNARVTQRPADEAGPIGTR